MPRTIEDQLADAETEKIERGTVILKLRAERDALREALELCNGDDVRLNGCACKPLSKCYLHGQIVVKALGLECSS